ncbi:MAG: serpin family protein, partial [Lachnospiraceae bacterium]|nr:serpin family protein [Lachnospiraceae bacterium]
MMKKGMIITSTAIMAACLFSACASKNSEKINGQITEQSQADMTKEEKDLETIITDLSENTAVGVCIDYEIESYENVQQFGYDLFAQNIQDQNPVLSPISAYLALSMAGCGADGTTKDEFYKVLGNDMMSLSDDMMNTLPAKGDLLQVSIADSVWIDNAFIVDGTWLGTVKSLMDAEVFQSELATETVMEEINHWINDKTNGLIDKLLTKPLDDQTRLALINTVYFKGKWEIPFEPQDTHEESFYANKGTRCMQTEQVDMMNLYMTDLAYIANDFAEGVILPYQKNDDSSSENLAFVALKPTGDTVIRDIYPKLTNQVISDLLAHKQTQLVNLKLPKFEITFDKVLNETLSNMGLVECFDMEKANFDQMGKTQSGDNLYIGLVQQRAKIIVDEEGTEAAAVTEVFMDCGAALADPKEVYFNEPFLYMIMDMDREIPLFIGILDDMMDTCL